MTWTDKGFFNASVGLQTGSDTLATATTFDLYDETASVATSQKVSGGAFFDLTAGYKVRRNLAAAVGYSRSGSSGDAVIAASIPDPRVHDRPRPITASASDLNHSESAIHLMGVWMVPVTDKIDVGISAGPTVFMVKQDLPSALAVSEPGPTVTNVTVTKADKTTVGINLGVDVTYLITPRWGVGGLARFTYGSAELEGATEKLSTGGFQIGGGLRVRF